MANPTQYEPSYSFSGFQTQNPTQPLPAPQVDNELWNVSLSVTEAIAGLADIRREDGALRNGVVTIDSLSGTAVAYLEDLAENAGAAGAEPFAEAAALSAAASAQARNESRDWAQAAAGSAGLAGQRANLALNYANTAEQRANAAAASAGASADSAGASAASAADANTRRLQAASSAGQASDHADRAQAFIQEAIAGFLGFQDDVAYDFGSVADPLTYFNQDWGSI